MKKIIILFLFFLLPFVSAEEILKITLTYDSGKVSIKNIEKFEGKFYKSTISPEEGYKIITYQNNNEIYSEQFEFPLYSIVEGGGIFQSEKAERTIFLPYSEELTKLKVYSPKGELLIEKNIKSLNKNIYSLYLILFILLLIFVAAIIIIILLKKTK